jgi:hypothetical protein
VSTVYTLSVDGDIDCVDSDVDDYIETLFIVWLLLCCLDMFFVSVIDLPAVCLFSYLFKFFSVSVNFIYLCCCILCRLFLHVETDGFCAILRESVCVCVWQQLGFVLG